MGPEQQVKQDLCRCDRQKSRKLLVYRMAASPGGRTLGDWEAGGPCKKAGEKRSGS